MLPHLIQDRVRALRDLTLGLPLPNGELASRSALRALSLAVFCSELPIVSCPSFQPTRRQCQDNMEVWTDVNLVERPEDQEAIERQIQQQILDEKMSRELVAELAAYEQAGSHQAQLQPQRSTDAEEHYNSSATQLHATIQQDDLASLQLARSWAQSQREQSQQPSRPAKSGRRTGEHERERQSLIASERARQQQLQLDFERKHQLQKKGLPDETYEMPEQQQQQQLEGQHRQQQRRQQQPDGQPEGQQQPQKQSSSHQSCSANPWSFVPALHLRPNQYGLIEPPRDSHLAAHGFELVKLVKVDRFQETCVAEFLEPKDTSGEFKSLAYNFPSGHKYSDCHCFL